MLDRLLGNPRILANDIGSGGAPATNGSEADRGNGTPAPYGPSERAAARRAREDERYDEYGLEKPAVSYQERFMDYVAPKEVMNDPDTSAARKIAGSLAAAPAQLFGSVFDALSPVNTRGDWIDGPWGLPIPKGPIMTEVAEGEEKKRYQQERKEKQEELEKRMRDDVKQREEWERCQKGEGPQVCE